MHNNLFTLGELSVSDEINKTSHSFGLELHKPPNSYRLVVLSQRQAKGDKMLLYNSLFAWCSTKRRLSSQYYVTTMSHLIVRERG